MEANEDFGPANKILDTISIFVSKEFGTDATNAFIINEAAFKQLEQPPMAGLQVSMSDAEFDAALGGNIDKIYRASV